MDRLPSWPSQRSESLSLPWHDISPTDGSDAPLQLLYALQQDPELCQTVGLEPQFAKQAISQLLLNQLNSEALRREFTSPASDKSTSPELDPDSARLSERRTSVSDGSRSNRSPQEHGKKLDNRRIQNRAAQRRFRERKAEQVQVLQTKLTDLKEKHDQLSDQLSKRSEEMNLLKSENEGLKSEVEKLRQRWQSLLLLLRNPKSLQILTMLVGSEEGSEGPGSGIADLDQYLPCIEALMLENDKA